MRFLENYNRKKLENPEYDVEIEECKQALEKLEMVRKISNSSMYDAAIASVL